MKTEDDTINWSEIIDNVEKLKKLLEVKIGRYSFVMLVGKEGDKPTGFVIKKIIKKTIWFRYTSITIQNN